MEKQIRWGIIGCGSISSKHAEAINRVASAVLVATADIIPERAQRLAAKYGAPYWYGDYNQMLQRDDIDVVSVCVPSGLHGEITEAIAKSGKHVFCEKPIEITKQAMDSMIQTCHDNQVKLGCVFQMRTHYQNAAARKAIAENRLGKMVLADASLKYYRSPEYYKSASWRGTWDLDGGGALMNQGVHGIDLLLWMMGEVESVVAHADHLLHHIEVEDTAVAILKFKNGAFGVIEGATTVNPGLGARFELHGQDGTIILEDNRIVAWHVPGLPNPEEENAEKAISALCSLIRELVRGRDSVTV